MAGFEEAQRTYIENTIQLAISNQGAQFVAQLAEGKRIQDEIVALVKENRDELFQNSNRVSQLVDKANVTADEIKNSTDKIAEAQSLLQQLNDNIQTYANNQSTIIAEQQAKVEQLNAQTAEALAGLDGKLSHAVSIT